MTDALLDQLAYRGRHGDLLFTVADAFDWLDRAWVSDSVRWAVTKLVATGIVIDTGSVTEPIRVGDKRKARAQRIYRVPAVAAPVEDPPHEQCRFSTWCILPNTHVGACRRESVPKVRGVS